MAYSVYILSQVSLYLWTNAMRLGIPSCSILVPNLFRLSVNRGAV